MGSGLVTVRRFQRNSGRFRWTGNKLHHAAQRFAAVEAGRAFLGDLHARDRFGGDAVPENPAAERIVERNSILEDERTAGAVGTQTAQRDSLSRRVRGTAAGSAEQAKAG